MTSQPPKPPRVPGESFFCRHCGKTSVTKLETVMDGWTYVGEVLVCALCKSAVGDSTDSASATAGQASASGSESAADAGLDRLASLLDERPAEAQRLQADGEVRFCRDCLNFLRHPFVSRCLLHDKPVEPMDDCEHFERRPDSDTTE